MAFFAEKVRRTVAGNGCGVAADHTPRAASGKDLQQLLQQNHRYVFSLIHKFNQTVKPTEPYSERDDIIVISDEAHRTQAGTLARNMREALAQYALGDDAANDDNIEAV
jgi:type I restriction enzyme, R subunit